MQIKKSTLKQIRKYAKLRAGNEPALRYKILKRVYVEASDTNRKLYDKEISQYIKAIQDKKIEKGQSILHLVAN
jgi:hypothetical protein